MKDFLKEFLSSVYAVFACIWLFAGIMFVMRTIKELGLKTLAEKVHYTIYGIGSSMLIGWVVFEASVFMHLPQGLSGALGGLAGYMGASTISSMVLKYLHSKLGGKKDDTKPN